LLGLGLVVLAITNLGSVVCGSGDSLPAGQKGLVLGVAGAVSVLAVAAGSWRWLSLRRARDLPEPHWPPAAGGGAALLLAVLVLVGEPDEIAGLIYVGAALTGILLVPLLINWILGRSSDEVGLLLPIYLFGAGACCYPLLARFAIAVAEGGFC
jgi:hypothetical protein